MSLESPNQKLFPSQEKILTLEDIENLKAQYEQGKEALRYDNEKYLKKANKIDSEDAERVALARLGRVSIDASEEDLRLEERLRNLRS
jgi:hypothetical protein